MIVFASDLRQQGIPLVVGMYPCHDGAHWHINAIDVSDPKDPQPLDVLLSVDKIPTETEACARLCAVIEAFDPDHDPVTTLVFQAYDLDHGLSGFYLPEMPQSTNPLAN